MKKRILNFVILGLIGSLSVGIAIANNDSTKPKFYPIKAYEQIDKTKQGLGKYQAESKNKIKEVVENLTENSDILVTVTFDKFLNENQIEKLVKDYNIQPLTVKARAIETKNNNTRVTIQLASTKDSIIDKLALEHMSKRNDFKFKGFIELVGKVKQKDINNLAEDKSVFSVDPSADDYFADNANIDDTVPGVFWNLEDLQMVSE